MEIIPTILEKEWEKVVERLGQIGETTEWVQIDVIDGVFAEGKTFELENLKKWPEKKKWEIHLMVKEPIDWVNKCQEAGVARIIGQVEMMADRKAFVDRVKKAGMEAGLGFDIETKIEEIPKETDILLLMARKAGFQMADFEEKAWEKIKEAKKWGIRRGVDGGVRKEILEKLREEGVDIVYSGSKYLEFLNV